MWKMMVFMMLMATGCATTSGSGASVQSQETLLTEARENLKEGSFYEAERLAKKVIEADPEHEEALELVAAIEVHKQELYEAIRTSAVPEEVGGKAQAEMIKTWLERSRTFLEMEQYPEALAAAEEVFQYEPNHAEASRLIDRIKGTFREGQLKANTFLDEIQDGEIKTKIEQYRRQAKEDMEKESWGRARFTVQKILLLTPNDREAKSLLEEINRQLKRAENETRETL